MRKMLSRHVDYMILGAILIFNILVWSTSYDRIPNWSNVPPAPSSIGATTAFLGDKEVAYRTLALTLQSFGNQTGQVQALKDYNFENLGTWFDLEDSLNKKSNYVPFLAAYYFSASQDPSKIMPVIQYLRRVGTYPEPDKWRYLGQAVFLARHRMNDMPLAFELSDELSKTYGKTYKPGMPAWPLQMKAIIASDLGEKEMAYQMMLETLKTKKEELDPAEINYMVDEICHHLLSPEQSRKNPLCTDQK